jgi:hypothetical protein
MLMVTKEARRIGLAHAVNAPVIEWLLRGLSPRERSWPRFLPVFRRIEDVAFDELRTHPDLGLQLYGLFGGERAERGLVAGNFVVRDGRGVLVGLAVGTCLLALRTGPSRSDAARSLRARVEPGLGADWAVIEPWPRDLTVAEGRARQEQVAREALGHAESLGRSLRLTPGR